MAKSVVVIFTEQNARILVNPENIEQYYALPNASVDPDLTLVKGLSPDNWKLDLTTKQILPKAEYEKPISTAEIAPISANNVIYIDKVKFHIPKICWIIIGLEFVGIILALFWR